MLNMKIVTAVDSMKGSLTSIEANQIIANVFTANDHSVKEVAIADGGEGTVAAVIKNNDAQKISVQVRALNDQLVTADFAWLPSEKLAVIESAAASGIQFLDGSKRTHPSNTSSYGTGEMMLAALEQGAETIVVGLGGTGTIDGGIGLLSALGVLFFDAKNQLLPPIGSSLGKITRIDSEKLDPRLATVTVYIASDVDSPLIGRTGAVQMFGEQKGLHKNELESYEKEMSHYQKIIGTTNNVFKGDGAAGGIGFAIRLFLDGIVCSGFEFISEQTGLETMIQHADLVITGEGKMDSQSLQGKVPVGIGRIAKKYNVPVIAFVGSVKGEPELFYNEGISVIVPIIDQITTLDEALKNADKNLYNAVRRTSILMTLVK